MGGDLQAFLKRQILAAFLVHHKTQPHYKRIPDLAADFLVDQEPEAAAVFQRSTEFIRALVGFG